MPTSKISMNWRKTCSTCWVGAKRIQQIVVGILEDAPMANVEREEVFAKNVGVDVRAVTRENRILPFPAIALSS
jgi:hypothetical protein